ncbi:MAG: tetratricopeptide repeat protein, partial [Ginsengibacter sp.]
RFQQMKLLILFILAFVISISCKAQQYTGVDSLKEVVRKSDKDSNKVSNLLNLSYAMVHEKPDSAMQLAEEALNISQELKWQKGISLSLREKGLVYYYQSDFLNAIDYSQLALREGQSLHNKLLDASIYNNIANVYADLGQHEKAMDYYKKLLSAAREMNNKTYEMNALANIGTIYIELNKYDDAIENEQDALAIAKSQNDLNNTALIYIDIGGAYKSKGNTDEALHNFKTALQLARENNYTSTIALSLDNMAQTYALAEKYDSAETYALESLKYSKPNDAIQSQSEAYETLSIAYEKQHQPAMALDAYKQYIILRDSIVNDEKKQEITKKEMTFEAEKKEAVLKAEHTAEIKQEKTVKNAAIIIAAIVLAGALISFIFYKRKRDARQKLEEAEFKTEVADTEMKALRFK